MKAPLREEETVRTWGDVAQVLLHGRNGAVRKLFGLMPEPQREDGSLDVLEALCAVARERKGSPRNYNDFQPFFVGAAVAISALSSEEGHALASASSAPFVWSAWSARVRKESWRQLFGITPPVSTTVEIAPGVGLLAGGAVATGGAGGVGYRVETGGAAPTATFLRPGRERRLAALEARRAQAALPPPKKAMSTAEQLAAMREEVARRAAAQAAQNKRELRAAQDRRAPHRFAVEPTAQPSPPPRRSRSESYESAIEPATPPVGRGSARTRRVVPTTSEPVRAAVDLDGVAISFSRSSSRHASPCMPPACSGNVPQNFDLSSHTIPYSRDGVVKTDVKEEAKADVKADVKAEAKEDVQAEATVDLPVKAEAKEGVGGVVKEEAKAEVKHKDEVKGAVMDEVKDVLNGTANLGGGDRRPLPEIPARASTRDASTRVSRTSVRPLRRFSGGDSFDVYASPPPSPPAAAPSSVSSTERPKPRKAAWEVLPWALVGVVFVAICGITAVVTADIDSSVPYVMWPWYYAFLTSLLYTFLVQETAIVLVSACCRRTRASRTAARGMVHAGAAPSSSSNEDDSASSCNEGHSGDSVSSTPLQGSVQDPTKEGVPKESALPAPYSTAASRPQSNSTSQSRPKSDSSDSRFRAGSTPSRPKSDSPSRLRRWASASTGSSEEPDGLAPLKQAAGGSAAGGANLVKRKSPRRSMRIWGTTL